MSELSIFIDESGDFGPYEHHAPYYVITLVFHDQSHSIMQQLAHFESKVRNAGFSQGHNVHTAPLIRRENEYSAMEMTERRKLFRSLFGLLRQCDVSYKSFVFRKREYADHDQLVSRISREIGLFVRTNLDFFQSFDRLIVYYDNGQKEITNIINTIFNAFLDAEVRKVKPSDYGLFQVADMCCTLELITVKLNELCLSRSETEFFLNARSLKKNYLKPLDKKRFA